MRSISIALLLVVTACTAPQPSSTRHAAPGGPIVLSDQALRIHRDAPVFDGHNDTVLSMTGSGRSFLARSSEGHIDLPRAREGGLGGGFFAVYIRDPAVKAPGSGGGPISRTGMTRTRAPSSSKARTSPASRPRGRVTSTVRPASGRAAASGSLGPARSTASGGSGGVMGMAGLVYRRQAGPAIGGAPLESGGPKSAPNAPRGEHAMTLLDASILLDSLLERTDPCTALPNGTPAALASGGCGPLDISARHRAMSNDTWFDTDRLSRLQVLVKEADALIEKAKVFLQELAARGFTLGEDRARRLPPRPS